MKDLTEAEKEALTSLLYLATHDETVNTALRASYSSARAGNSGMLVAQDFTVALASLYARSCK